MNRGDGLLPFGGEQADADGDGALEPPRLELASLEALNGGLPARPPEVALGTIRRIRSVYHDVVLEEPRLAAVLGRAMTMPERVAALGFELIGCETQEVFVALHLNSQYRLAGVVEVSRGTLTSSLVHPREVFAPALRELAAALIVLHNHPSGDPEPSAEDRAVTKRLSEAGKLLGVPLLDHVVIGSSPETFVSLRSRMDL